MAGDKGLFDSPNNLWEHQLREIFKAHPQAKQDPLFQILSIVFQSSANMGDVGDAYRLLGLEDFTRLIHLLDGRTIRFPTSMDLKEAVILTLCYYYRKVEGREWSDIHELLPFEFNSIAISRRIKNLDEEFQEKIQSIMMEAETMEDMQDEARELAGALGNRRLKNDALRVMNTDPLEDLKLNLMQFFKDRVAAIKESEDLRRMLYLKLQEQLETGSLTFDQLMQMYRSLGNENNTAADGILSMFKPAPGSPSLFLEVTRPVDKDEEIKKAHKNYTAEELQAIEKTMTRLEQMGRKNVAQDAEAEIVE